MNMVVTTFGGLGLFIYGMNLMGDSLQKAAGSKLRDILSFLTKNKIMGIILGTIVTMLIQSSSATTVMVVGFVNAGLMNLTQAFSVIMGANVGTTITSQIIAFKLTDFAPIAIGIGVAAKLIFKSKSKKDIADIIIGFGLLFAGMNMMGSGLANLKDNPIFSIMMIKLENPWLGILVGFVVTTIVQSSSATIGILQALAGQGLISFPVAFSILLGENIGTTTTAMLSSLGASKNAKRAALLHFLFNAGGSLIFMAGLRFPVEALVTSFTPNDIIRQIANGHTIFNLTNVLVQAPFSKIHIKIVNTIVKGEDKEIGMSLKYLDKRMIQTSSVANVQIKKEIDRMFSIASNNIVLANDALVNKKFELVDTILQNEKTLNFLADEITAFIVELNRTDISEEHRNNNDIYIYTLNDIERVGDHLKNIAEASLISNENNIEFSDMAKEELNYIFSLCAENLKNAQIAYEKFDIEIAREVVNLEEVIDDLEEDYKTTHIQRLSDGSCEVKSGVMFLDVISNLERISDHSSKIAYYIIDNKIIKDSIA
jgi:phosphate:Na+ symporter